MSILSGFVLSLYRNCFDTLSLIIISIIVFSFPATAKPNPHDNFYPDWDNVSSDTYCSIFSSYKKQDTLISSIQFNYFKKPKALPLQLQAYFPEIIDYQKSTELKIFLNNGKIQHHIMYTIDRFERSVWLLNNNEEEMLTTLLNARLITVSAIGTSGKEYLLKFAVYPKKFMKEKEWLYTCMERDREYLKYLKKTLLKYL